MTDDITAILIQRILSEAQSNTSQNVNASSSALSDSNSLIGAAANYAQLLSTAAGPIEQALAIAYSGGALAASGGAAAVAATATTAGTAAVLSTQGAYLAAGATTAGIGAAIVLVFSVILAALSDTSASAQTEALNELVDALDQLQQEFIALDLGKYWQGKFTDLNSLWTSSNGGLGDDLDNLASEGIGPQATYVNQNVVDFHTNAMGFVNQFIQAVPGAPADFTPRSLGPPTFWLRPVLPQVFFAQMVPYPAPGLNPGGIENWSTMGWYGNLPQPQPAPATATANVCDPKTMLPYLLLGIQSYLSLQMLAPLISPSQLTFDLFLQQYGPTDLKDYAEFLNVEYLLGVNGILKSDAPGIADLIGFVNFMLSFVMFPMFSGSQPSPAELPTADLNLLPPNVETTAATAGYCWNGVYGAIDTYPQYGFYPSLPVPVPGALPSSVIDIIDAEAAGKSLFDEWRQANIWPAQLQGGPNYMMQATLEDWVLPWLQNKLTLARMARWKAIYLLNGYDQVWATIQRLRYLSNPSQPSNQSQPTLSDGTIATGDWSARELFTIMNIGGTIMNGIQTSNLESDSLITIWSQSPLMTGYSVSALVQVLDNIADGNWAGPPTGARIAELSFRGRLAAAAV
ncbi:hypothetical protein [Mycobacterium sp.]|uniref:hypothetical protein n=1 Tax=Mycobacterium sp. TaxID=1785 RepID=UPI003F949CE3